MDGVESQWLRREKKGKKITNRPGAGWGAQLQGRQQSRFQGTGSAEQPLTFQVLRLEFVADWVAKQLQQVTQALGAGMGYVGL